MRPTRLLCLLVPLMLVLSSCSLIGGDNEEATDVAVENQTSTTTVALSTTEAPATTAAEGAGTFDDPRSIINGTFTYTEDFYDTDWTGELYGLVEVPLENYSDAVGTCYALVGIMSPTRIGDGSISEGYTAPSLGLVVDGVLVDQGFDCDIGPVSDVGYGPLFDAQVTEGTDFAFYAAFLVEGDPASTPTAVSLGGSNDDEIIYFTADVISSAPVPDVQTGAGAGDVDDLLNAQFRYRGEFDDVTWDAQLVGIVEGEKESYIDESGSCLILLGSLTPTEIDGGQLSEGFDTPDFTVLAAGTQIDDESNCDTETIEAAGYGRLYDAEVTLGTVYPFYAEFFIPEGATAESLIVGDPTEDGGARFYSIDLIDAVPPADTSSSLGTLPDGITPLTGASFTYTDFFSETSWEGVIDGLVAIDVDSFNDDQVGRCFAVVGVITPTEIIESSVTDGFDTPDIGLIASGRSVAWNSFVCTDESLKANGYQELANAEIPVGTAYPYFVTFFVPGDDTVSLDSVFIGDSSEPDTLYFDTAVLADVPTRN